MALANEIAAISPSAIVLAKQALNAIEDISLQNGYRFEQTMTVEVGRTEDAAEATKSFWEKESQSLGDAERQAKNRINGSLSRPFARFLS